MAVAIIFILFFVGLAIGSFLTAYTYRFTRKSSVVAGRSFCDNCNAELSWYDNIPLLSYIALGGKCRSCNKKISIRYPLIEFGTALTFVAMGAKVLGCSQGSGDVICSWTSNLGVIGSLIVLLVITAALIAIFIIDFEHTIIPDELIYLMLLTSFLYLLLVSSSNLYLSLLTAFMAGLFFLTLHLVTMGKGMGLGDVKLALAGGLLLGFPSTLVWIMLSFVIGAVAGVLLIIAGRAKFRRQIPFGPFMVVSFFLALFYGERTFKLLFPFGF